MKSGLTWIRTRNEAGARAAGDNDGGEKREEEHGDRKRHGRQRADIGRHGGQRAIGHNVAMSGGRAATDESDRRECRSLSARIIARPIYPISPSPNVHRRSFAMLVLKIGLNGHASPTSHPPVPVDSAPVTSILSCPISGQPIRIVRFAISNGPARP